MENMFALSQSNQRSSRSQGKLHGVFWPFWEEKKNSYIVQYNWIVAMIKLPCTIIPTNDVIIKDARKPSFLALFSYLWHEGHFSSYVIFCSFVPILTSRPRIVKALLRIVDSFPLAHYIKGHVQSTWTNRGGGGCSNDYNSFIRPI